MGSCYSLGHHGRAGGSNRNHEVLTSGTFQPTNNVNNNRGHMMSDVASSILTDDLEGPPIGNNGTAHRVVLHYHQQYHRRTPGRQSFHSSTGSSLTSSDHIMSVVRDADIGPNDAADAGDPGRVNSLQYVEQLEREQQLQQQEIISVCCGPAAIWKPATICAAIDALIALAEPDIELQRIIAIGIPLTLGAMSTTFFHLIISVSISNFISIEAMVAYVITHLLLGLTRELVGSISDAQSTLCSHALSMGDWRLAGQYAQIAILFIILVNIPLIFLWGKFMEPVVYWMVGKADIAQLAKEYTNVVLLWQLVLQGISRALTVLFHLTGHEAYETQCALAEGIIQLVCVTCIAAIKKEEATLAVVGGVQFMIAIAAFVAKIVNAFLRRWLRIFTIGMCHTCALRASTKFI